MTETTNVPPEKAAEIRRYLHRWAEAGPQIEAFKYEELRQLSDDDRRRIANDLLSLWRPGLSDDEAEGLGEMQRVFALYRERHMRR